MLPFELTKDIPYLALSGELWSVFYEYFNRNWSCYKGFLLYLMTVTDLTTSDNGAKLGVEIRRVWKLVDHHITNMMQQWVFVDRVLDLGDLA